jgi:adenylate kinase family enzyme
VLERFKVYHRDTQPLVDYYKARSTFRAVNGAQPPDRVATDLAKAIDSASGNGAHRGAVR